ncbi:hypothetical protein CKAH01_12635 [Colletotrichum kahawae]|uniref:Uncharacterized protein n=1 Tax=Colletotrichum kahawae TaxID=34407 RepID=A0AAD9YT34_COLKA|nr:hypothetical protein CKAH01_12635 [Colletotrichum kahawae]
MYMQQNAEVVGSPRCISALSLCLRVGSSVGGMAKQPGSATLSAVKEEWEYFVKRRNVRASCVPRGAMLGNACNHGQRDPSTMHTANAGGFCNFTGRPSTLPWLMARQAVSARSTTVPHIPDSPPGPAIFLLLACSLFGWHQERALAMGQAARWSAKCTKYSRPAADTRGQAISLG